MCGCFKMMADLARKGLVQLASPPARHPPIAIWQGTNRSRGLMIEFDTFKCYHKYYEGRSRTRAMPTATARVAAFCRTACTGESLAACTRTADRTAC